MVYDAPDFTTRVNVVIISTEPGLEKAITRLARLTTSSTEYQTVVSWTVTAEKIGILHNIEFMSDDYDHTNFKLTIAGVEQFTDAIIGNSLSLGYPDVRIASEAVILLEAKSTDGTEVIVDADITGKEIG